MYSSPLSSLWYLLDWHPLCMRYLFSSFGWLDRSDNAFRPIPPSLFFGVRTQRIAEMRLYTIVVCYSSIVYSLQLWLLLLIFSCRRLFLPSLSLAISFAVLSLSLRSLSRSLSSNYLACWSTELGQWGWSYASLMPSSNIPSQQAWSLCSLEVSRGVLIVQINVSYLLVMLLLVVLRNIIS